jgi:hypothetical protein
MFLVPLCAVAGFCFALSLGVFFLRDRLHRAPGPRR